MTIILIQKQDWHLSAATNTFTIGSQPTSHTQHRLNEGSTSWTSTLLILNEALASDYCFDTEARPDMSVLQQIPSLLAASQPHTHNTAWMRGLHPEWVPYWAWMHTLQLECIPYSLNAYPVGIQDFPEGGAPTPKSAIIFQIFCQKLHENERIWAPRGAHVPGTPLGSTNATLQWTLI